MNNEATSRSETLQGNRADLPLWSLLPFLVITFTIAWGVLGLYLLLPDQMAGELTGQHPLFFLVFFLAVYAPAIAAFILVLYYKGPVGLVRFLSRLLLWRCSLAWYAFLLIGVPLVFYAGSWWKGTLFSEPFSFASLSPLLTALLFAVIRGPVEEFGWRGLALPLLQRKVAPFWAGLILGFIWGLWHLPTLLLSGTQQSEWSFAPFFIGCIALSTIVTPLFNASRGSILLTALFHFVLVFHSVLMPDAQPYDTYLFVVVAALVVWFNRRTLFTRKGSVTEVVPRPTQ
jgi:uncharacterized protein